MKRILLSVVTICLLVTLTASPARAHWEALGGFIAGTFFGAAISGPPVVYAAPVYPRPVYIGPPSVYLSARYALRYDGCGHRYRSWNHGYYRQPSRY